MTVIEPPDLFLHRAEEQQRQLEFERRKFQHQG